jgi:hypothetical protein
MKKKHIKHSTSWGAMAVAMSLFVGQAYASDVKVSGQVRGRTMVIKKSTAEDAPSQTTTQLRTRLAVDAKPADNVDIRVEMQDSRVMGSEASTVANSANVDLHQAFVKLNFGESFVKAGRQKIKMGSQRFISSLEWHPNARVFDGVLASGYGLTGMALFLTEGTTGTSSEDVSLYGLHYQNSVSSALKYEAYTYYDKSEILNRDLVYLGGRLYGKTSPVLYDAEFIYQAGEVGELTSSAFYLATKVGMAVDKHKFFLGFDMMSGDDDASDDTYAQYHNSYAFAHAHFGWMDYILGNPGTGAMDIYASGIVALPGKSTLKAFYHLLLPAATPTGVDSDPYGQEIDLEIHGKWFPKSKIVLGASVFIPGKGSSLLASAGPDDEVGYQFYIMPIFNF